MRVITQISSLIGVINTGTISGGAVFFEHLYVVFAIHMIRIPSVITNYFNVFYRGESETRGYPYII